MPNRRTSTRPLTRNRYPSPVRRSMWFGGGVALALALATRFALDGPWLLAYFVGVNGATAALYWLDKRRSVQAGEVRAGAARNAVGKSNLTRVPERVLHAWALAGGSPAALLSQWWLRHKTLKRSFRRWFWLICVTQILAAGWWVWWNR